MLLIITLSGLFSSKIVRDVVTFLPIIFVRREIVERFSETLEGGMVGMWRVWRA